MQRSTLSENEMQYGLPVSPSYIHCVETGQKDTPYDVTLCGRSFGGGKSSFVSLLPLGGLAGHWLGGGEQLLVNLLLYTFICICM